MRYEGQLPVNIDGITRVSLIHTFRTWKGELYNPLQIPVLCQF